VTETIRLGDVEIAVTRKAVKNVHLSVHPPTGHVTLVAPSGTRMDVARAYAISKLRGCAVRTDLRLMVRTAHPTTRAWLMRFAIAHHILRMSPLS